MCTTSVEQGINALRNGELVIVFDDVKAQMASLVGIAERVSPQKVNVMTKIGKGLVYVCITEDRAEKLKLPYMVENSRTQMKQSTISVDFITTTTGISAFERADTIKAFTDEDVNRVSFRSPGHIFPLVSRNKGLLQRVDIVEASVDLATMSSDVPVAFICEILNASGNIATITEITDLAKARQISVLNISDILEYKRNEILHSFTGIVIKGKQSGRKVGFPTANIQVDSNKVPLDKGVYGVHVFVNQRKYIGVMNVGVRCEVHLLDFNSVIYDQFVKIDVRFVVREEILFSTLDELIFQIDKDIEFVENRFGLQKVNH